MVYFIEHTLTNHVKIGYTGGTAEKDVLKRMKSIQCGTPCKLRLLAFCRGNKKDEAKLHDKFSHLQESGEWFRKEDELSKYIHQIASSQDPQITTSTTMYELTLLLRHILRHRSSMSMEKQLEIYNALLPFFVSSPPIA